MSESGDLELLLLRDCLGGERVAELQMPRAVELADLDRVAGVVTRVVLHSLPRPFFKLDVPGHYLITGVVGDRRLRVTVRLALRNSAAEAAVAVARAMLGST